MKKILSLLIMLTLTLLLAACSGGKDNGSGNDTDDGASSGANSDEKVKYTVTVLNSDGNFVPNVIVKVIDGTTTLVTKPTDKNGSAAFELAAGDYTVTLTPTGNESYSYDESALVLTKAAPNLTVTFTQKATESVELYVGSPAYLVNVGTYDASFEANGITYFLFIPTATGRYKFSVETSVGASVGNYGSPAFIYETDISDEADREGGALYVDVRSYNVGETQDSTTPYLVGVKADATAKGILRVERVGEPQVLPAELPWADYVKTKEILPFTFSGGSMTDIDVQDITVSVVLGDDGYYHYGSADGPTVYLRLTVASPYLASFEEMAETQFFGRYFYGDDGEFLGKTSYHDMLLEYIAASDAGVYPLTEDLAVMVKNMGDYLGWFTPAAPGEENSVFGNKPITKNSWLFACVYVSED